ncbi:hypothetical protein ACJX0J_005642, partial [Zea mays]
GLTFNLIIPKAYWAATYFMQNIVSIIPKAYVCYIIWCYFRLDVIHIILSFKGLYLVLPVQSYQFLHAIDHLFLMRLFVSIIYMHLHVFGTHTKTIHSELLESIMLHTLFSFVIIIVFVWHLTHFIFLYYLLRRVMILVDLSSSDSGWQVTSQKMDIQVYDPFFILRFSIHTLHMGYIEPAQFARLGLLAITLVPAYVQILAFVKT